MTHELKTLHCFFEAVKSGEKTFGVRKDDRGFAVGDTLRLVDFDTGETLEREVGYILPGGEYGLAEGYVVLGLRPVMKTYTIKPLVWHEEEDADQAWSIKTIVGDFWVYFSLDAQAWKASGNNVFGLVSRSHPTLDAAKQAAWDAYVSRIEQALEVVK